MPSLCIVRIERRAGGGVHWLVRGEKFDRPGRRSDAGRGAVLHDAPTPHMWPDDHSWGIHAAVYEQEFCFSDTVGQLVEEAGVRIRRWPQARGTGRGRAQSRRRGGSGSRRKPSAREAENR